MKDYKYIPPKELKEKKPLSFGKKLVYVLYEAIFSFWNLVFLGLVYAGMLPLLAGGLVEAVSNGTLRLEFFLALIGAIAVPTVFTVIGVLAFIKKPVKLIHLFYGVEAPLFILCLVRLFILRELTPASHLVIATLFICMMGFFLELIGDYAHQSRVLASAQLAIHTLLIVIGTAVAALIGFHVMPVVGVIWQEFWKFHWLDGLWWMLTDSWRWQSIYEWIVFGPVMAIFITISATVFILMPLFLINIYIRSGHRILKQYSLQYGKKRMVQGVGAVLTLWFMAFLILNQQPQVKAFELLAQPPQTDGEKVALLNKSETIRRGLVNAYLSGYRYLSPVEDSNIIADLYQYELDLSPQAAQFVQNAYNNLISPFLYQGSRSDRQKAEKLYETFFDLPIQKGEKEAVQRALKSTVILDEAKAGVMNIDEKRVWLRSQNINLTPHDNWADVEIHEVYENRTNDVEEILYYFSLPESAVVTGVWLGDTGDRDRRFTFQVSPRGAAQKVYNSQVRRSRPIDPALLEQVGPRNYRLRAFPVPPRNNAFVQGDPDAPTEMNLWLTYKVMRQKEGWALPKLGEKRNIYWDKKSERLRQGRKVKGDKENWLPEFLPAPGKYRPQAQEVNLAEGYRLSFRPLKEKDYVLPKGKRFAVVLDSSRSMDEHSQEVAETFNWLKKHGFADNSFSNNDADLYLTSPSGEAQRLDDLRNYKAQNQVFYGKLSLKNMLRQFVKLQKDTNYDGIIVLTDASNYEFSNNKKDAPQVNAPLWIVNLGSLAPAYGDGILKVIQDSQGGVATQLPEVLQRIGTKSQLGSKVVGVSDGYGWFWEPGTEKTTSDPDLAPIAAKQLTQSLSKETNGNSVAQLDAIHAIAKKYKIVTPYSSMIVLVNDEQREALKKAESEEDRFDRKVENGKEDLTQPNNPLTNSSTSIPEPRAIIGIIPIAIYLFTRRRKRRQAIPNLVKKNPL